MKKLLLSLFLVLLFFTLISCNNEVKVVAPEEMSNEDRSVIDSVFADFEAEKTKGVALEEGEKTELEKIIDLNNPISFSYRNATVKDNSGSTIASFTIDSTSSTITVEITNASYPKIKDLEGTISYAFGSNFPTLFGTSTIQNVSLSYVDADTGTRIEVNKEDETFSFTDLEDYLDDIYIHELISDGFESKYKFGTIYLKGKANFDESNINLNPLRVDITEPLPINDRFYTGKIEINLSVVTGEESVNIDGNGSFTLTIKDNNNASINIKGKLGISLTIATIESVKFDYKCSLESFSINNKLINPKQAEEYIMAKINSLSTAEEVIVVD